MKEERILDRLHCMAESLKSNQNIIVTSCKFNPPAESQVLSEIQETFKLDPGIIDFYSQCNGIYIQWERCRNPELNKGHLAAGIINLLPVQQVFSDWRYSIFFDDNDPKRFLHPIDYFALGSCTALYLDGSENPAVYYYSKGDEMKSLGINFEQYLQLLLKSRGYWYWSLYLVESKYRDPLKPITMEESNFMEVMPQLFPDFELSDFQKFQ